MVDFVDFELRTAWYGKQSREVRVTMATRAALRAAAGIALVDTTTLLGHALPVFRAMLTAGVASIKPSPEIRAAAGSAASFANDRSRRRGAVYAALSLAGVAATSAVDAAIAATHTANVADEASASNAADAAATASFSASDFVAAVASDRDAAIAASDAALSALSRDSDCFDAGDSVEQLFRRKPWEEGTEPPDLTVARATLLDFLDSDPAVWGFWKRWYQGMVDGHPMDWELQRRVALIPDAVWQDGPAAVAAEIARIEAEFLAEAVPQAERAEVDAATGKVRFVPIPVENPRLLGAVLGQVADALDDALSNPSNGLSERSREAKVLRRTVLRHGNDPQRIEMDFVSVHAGLARQIVTGELPPSEENLALQAALEEGARGIRATHPDVAENRAILTRQAVVEMPQEAVEEILAAAPVLAAISVPDLADELAEDAAEIEERWSKSMVMRRTLGPAARNPGLAACDAEVRLFSRVAKIGILLRKTPDLVHRIDQSTGYKAARILTTVAGIVTIGIAFLSSFL